MAEYIDRAELMKRIENQAENWGEDYDAWQILGDIEDFPAADVLPVVHATWQATEAYPHNVYCTHCYKIYAQTHWTVWEDGSLPRDFCPACGARMDGVE